MKLGIQMKYKSYCDTYIMSNLSDGILYLNNLYCVLTIIFLQGFM